MSEASGPGPREGAPDERFPRSIRLRRSADFRQVQRNGARVVTAHLVAIHQANDLDGPRFGLAVSRKVGNAVIRNRVKRWLREAIRRQHAGRLAGRDVVFIARTSAAGSDYRSLAAEVDQLFGQIVVGT